MGIAAIAAYFEAHTGCIEHRTAKCVANVMDRQRADAIAVKDTTGGHSVCPDVAPADSPYRYTDRLTSPSHSLLRRCFLHLLEQLKHCQAKKSIRNDLHGIQGGIGVPILDPAQVGLVKPHRSTSPAGSAKKSTRSNNLKQHLDLYRALPTI